MGEYVGGAVDVVDMEWFGKFVERELEERDWTWVDFHRLVGERFGLSEHSSDRKWREGKRKGYLSWTWADRYATVLELTYVLA